MFLWVLVLVFLFLRAPAQAGNLSSQPGGLIVIDKNLMEMIAPKSPQIAGSSSSSLSEVAGNIATENGLPPQLVKSIIRAESNGDPGAVSSKGAIGLMQLMPETAKEYRVSNPFDPVANLRGGVEYLRDLLQEFSGNLSLALAAYNAGPGAVRKYQGIPPYPETQSFVEKVRERYQQGEEPIQGPVHRRANEMAFGERIGRKIHITGSPRDLAAFLKKMRSTGLEASTQ